MKGSVSTTEEKTSAQMLACVTIFLGSFCVGTALSWSVPCVIQLTGSPRFFTLTHETYSWVVSLMPLGALLATPMAAYVGNHMGPKRTMLMGAGLSTLGWLVICVAHAIEMIYLGRILTGMGVATLCLIAPTYAQGTGVERIRHAMSKCSQVMLSAGILFTYSVGTVARWDWLSLVCCAVCCLLMLCIARLPESPAYLIQRGMGAAAREAMSRLKSSSDQDWQADLADLYQSFYVGILPPFRATFVPMLMLVLQQLSGVMVVVMNIGSMLESVPAVPLDRKMAALALSAAMTVTSILATFRCRFQKFKTAASCGIMAASMMALAMWNYGYEMPSWSSQLALLTYVMASSSGFLAIPWQELSSLTYGDNAARKHLLAIASAVFWGFGFAWCKSQVTLADVTSPEMVLWLQSVFGVLGVIVAITCFETPESRLDDSQVFEGN